MQKIKEEREKEQAEKPASESEGDSRKSSVSEGSKDLARRKSSGIAGDSDVAIKITNSSRNSSIDSKTSLFDEKALEDAYRFLLNEHNRVNQ